MSKASTRKFLDKAVVLIFANNLPRFISVWLSEAPDKTFDEFLLDLPVGNKSMKFIDRSLYNAFRRVIPQLVDAWKSSGTDKTFDEHLLDTRQRLIK